MCPCTRHQQGQPPPKQASKQDRDKARGKGLTLERLGLLLKPGVGERLLEGDAVDHEAVAEAAADDLFFWGGGEGWGEGGRLDGCL